MKVCYYSIYITYFEMRLNCFHIESNDMFRYFAVQMRLLLYLTASMLKLISYCVHNNNVKSHSVLR
jgi:hypothetical protein